MLYNLNGIYILLLSHEHTGVNNSLTLCEIVHRNPPLLLHFLNNFLYIFESRLIIFQLNILGTCFILHAHTFVIIITGINMVHKIMN